MDAILSVTELCETYHQVTMFGMGILLEQEPQSLYCSRSLYDIMIIIYSLPSKPSVRNSP